MFTEKYHKKCFIYEGDQFNFELVLSNHDDIYSKNTLLWGIVHNDNIISNEPIFNNEIDLSRWNNTDFNLFIKEIILNKACSFECFVKRNPTSIKMTYDNNILTIPLYEDVYYVSNVILMVNKTTINELSILYSHINIWLGKD